MMLALILSTIIGLLLGLLGGGGSVLTVPMLVYLLHIDVKNAIVTSFVVVGISSLTALITHARRGSVCWKSGALFGLTGLVSAFSCGHLVSQLSGDLLMALFGGISLLAGLLMIRSSNQQVLHGPIIKPLKACPLQVPYLRVLFDGFIVGALTGMVGVGGGFLIVPALTLLVGFPVKSAVGTSLLIIAMNALAGLSGYSQHVDLDLPLTGIVAGGAVVGSAIGALWSAYINPDLLRRAFGMLVVLVSSYILHQSVTVQFIAAVNEWFSNPGNPEYAILSLLLLWLVLRIGSWIHKTDVVLLPPAKANSER